MTKSKAVAIVQITSDLKSSVNQSEMIEALLADRYEILAWYTDAQTLLDEAKNPNREWQFVLCGTKSNFSRDAVQFYELASLEIKLVEATES